VRSVARVPGSSSRAAAAPAALLLRCFGQRRLEQLTHDAEGEFALQLSSAGTKDAHAAASRRSSRRREQRRLADPGGPFDHHELASLRASLGQRRLDPRQLLTSFEQLIGGDGVVHGR